MLSLACLMRNWFRDHHIDKDCKVDPTAKIWRNASILRGSEIGSSCVIGANASVDKSSLEWGCKVGHGASIHPMWVIAQCVFIGPGAVLANDRYPSAGGWFDISMYHAKRCAGVIKWGASVGANAVLLPGITLGARSMVAAGAVVDRDVPGGHIFNRDGTIEKLPKDREERRMRFVRR